MGRKNKYATIDERKAACANGARRRWALVSDADRTAIAVARSASLSPEVRTKIAAMGGRARQAKRKIDAAKVA